MEKKDITIIGDGPDCFDIKDFKFHLHSHGIARYLPKWLYKALREGLLSSPVVQKNCIGCRECEKICPKKAITIVNKKSHIDYKKCIRCYCCQEICPYDAIKLKRPLTLRTLIFIRDIFRRIKSLFKKKAKRKEPKPCKK